MPYSPMALNNLNNPFSPQPSTPANQPEEPVYQSNSQNGQFAPPPEDPRSRHSSAGSDQGCAAAPRSAPLSPFHSSGVAPPPAAIGRQRHQSAGGLPAATLHYRPPVWGQTNGDHGLQGEFVLNNEVSGLVDSSERQFTYSQSQPATPLASDMQYPAFTNNHTSQGAAQSQHSSYNNTPIPQELGAEFGGVEGELEMAGMEAKLEPPGQKRKDNDDLDLALDALRDCDTDFSKFVQEGMEVGGTNGQ